MEVLDQLSPVAVDDVEAADVDVAQPTEPTVIARSRHTPGSRESRYSPPRTGDGDLLIPRIPRKDPQIANIGLPNRIDVKRLISRSFSVCPARRASPENRGVPGSNPGSRHRPHAR
jgi:hypothetical protein